MKSLEIGATLPFYHRRMKGLCEKGLCVLSPIVRDLCGDRFHLNSTMNFLQKGGEDIWALDRPLPHGHIVPA